MASRFWIVLKPYMTGGHDFILGVVVEEAA